MSLRLSVSASKPIIPSQIEHSKYEFNSLVKASMGTSWVLLGVLHVLVIELDNAHVVLALLLHLLLCQLGISLLVPLSLASGLHDEGEATDVSSSSSSHSRLSIR